MSEFENPNLPENLPEKRIEVVTMRVREKSERRNVRS